jgi:hypothetical protein
MFSSISIAPSLALAQFSSNVGFHYTPLKDVHLEDMLVEFETEQPDRGIRTMIARAVTT